MVWRSRVRVGLMDLVRRAAAEKRLLVIATAVFVASLVAFRWARAAAGFWEIDDAGITSAASFELAEHGSLAPYLEGPPIESYSNPLLFFLIALLRRIGRFDPVATHVHLEAIVFATMVLLVWSLLRHWTDDLAAAIAAAGFAVIELMTPATWIWYGSGLENVWLSAGLVTLLWICARTARGVPLAPAWGNVAFLVAVIRPEAPVHVAGFYAVLLVLARPPGVRFAEHAGRVARAGVVTAALFAAFLAWRYLTYHDLFANTYYAKLPGELNLERNLREYIVASVLPYGHASLFASSVLALLLIPRLAPLGQALLVFLALSLALPLVAGADFMGEHRFATAFLAICHLSYAAALAACVTHLSRTRLGAWRVGHLLPVLAILVVPALLAFDHNTIADPVPLGDVTVSRVAHLNGGQRWEHQMRLGVPNAVALLPDVGGALLIGSMQGIDNGYLTDFQTPRMGRKPDDPVDRREQNQYEHEERRPDLLDDNPYWPLDRTVLGTRYLASDHRMFARRDLVDVSQLDPRARPIYRDGDLTIYLSDATVPIAAPRSLVRCEIVVAWNDRVPDASIGVIAAIDGGSDDRIGLRPYEAQPHRMERRGLLLGAPPKPGSFRVMLDVVRDDHIVFSGVAFTLTVTTQDAQIRQASEEVLQDASAAQAARKIAWLREQLVPRMTMRGFHGVMDSLLQASRDHSAQAGAYIMHLRRNARLATLQRLPPAIRGAELAAMTRSFDACPGSGSPSTQPAGEPLAARILCLGRTVDQLRRLGYLGALARMPRISDELRTARGELEHLAPALRYRALVGLTLAIPSDLAMQRRLLETRAMLAASGAFPDL
jgi:hypothetical protein